MSGTREKDNKVSMNGVVFSWMHRLGKNINIFISHFRKFCFLNNSFIELLFLILYTLEQMVLIVVTYYYKNTAILVLAVSFFALIVLSTFSLHKLFMQSRIKYLEERLHEYIAQNEIIVQKSEYLAKAHSETVSVLRKLYLDNPQSLNNGNEYDTKKRKGV